MEKPSNPYLMYPDLSVAMHGIGCPTSDITLRDLFAGLAMQSMVASGDFGAENIATYSAKYSYKIADMMLKAREVQ